MNEGPDLSSFETPHFENDPTLGFSITQNSSVKDKKNLKDIFISVGQVPGFGGLEVPVPVPVPNQTGV